MSCFHVISQKCRYGEEKFTSSPLDTCDATLHPGAVGKGVVHIGKPDRTMQTFWALTGVLPDRPWQWSNRKDSGWGPSTPTMWWDGDWLGWRRGGLQNRSGCQRPCPPEQRLPDPWRLIPLLSQWSFQAWFSHPKSL